MTIESFPFRNEYWPPSSYNGKPDVTGSRKLPGDSGYQVTFSHDIRRLGRGDHGGPWLLEKVLNTYVYGYYQNKFGPNSGYRGPYLPTGTGPFDAYLLGALRSDASYSADGARAIAATEPTAPVFNGATAIGEAIADGGIPATKPLEAAEYWDEARTKVRRAKAAGSHYLEYQFGWAPFVSDLRNLTYAANNSNRIVNNYYTHANVPIRRTFQISDDLTQETAESTNFLRTFGTRNIGSATHYWTRSLRERMWFDGCFRYYMPMDNSMASRFKRYRAEARKLYGIEMTPEVVWNIAPWSWAVDWCYDVGSIIHNWSALGHNGLVLQYGYVMHSQETSIDVTAKGSTWSTSVIRKRRVAANPYGFGVSSSSLNGQQVAILAALGLSRGDARVIK